MTAIRIVLADDSEAVLTGIPPLLGDEFGIVATALNGLDTIREVLRADPDVLVLDISMPSMNGLEVAAHLGEIGCRTKIVYLTVHEQQDYISAAFSSGACAYVTKRRLASDLAPAIRAAAEGQTFISPSLRK